MEVVISDPDNHKIYGWITKEYFYRGLQRAKKENIFINEKGFVDINKLIQLLWETFSEGNYLVLENQEAKEKILEYIKNGYKENKPKRSHKKKVVEENKEEVK